MHLVYSEANHKVLKPTDQVRMGCVGTSNSHPSRNHRQARALCISWQPDLPLGLRQIRCRCSLPSLSAGSHPLTLGHHENQHNIPSPPTRLSATGKKIKACVAANTTSANQILK